MSMGWHKIARFSHHFSNQKITHFFSFLSIFMGFHFMMPHQLLSASAMTNFDALSRSLDFNESIVQSNYEFYAYGTCIEPCLYSNSYYYAFNRINIRLEIDGEIKPFYGDIIMQIPTITYSGNYFSFSQLEYHSMVLSRNFSNYSNKNLKVKFIYQGLLISEYDQVETILDSYHFGYKFIDFNEFSGLIVLGFNDSIFNILNASEKSKRLIFANDGESNFADLRNFDAIYFKSKIEVGLLSENMIAPQLEQVRSIQGSIIFWIFFMNSMFISLLYFIRLYVFDRSTFNRIRVFFFRYHLKKNEIISIDLLDHSRAFFPPLILIMGILLFSFIGYSLYSLIILSLFILGISLFSIIFFTWLGIEFQFYRLNKKVSHKI